MKVILNFDIICLARRTGVSMCSPLFEKKHRTLHTRCQLSDRRKEEANLTYQKFLPKLQDHLLGRLIDRSFDGDAHDEFSDVDRNSVRILGNKIYTVKTCQLHYTTYDLQRKHDTVNPTSHPDVMVRSSETGPNASPYWYARVLGVYHANVWTTNPAVKNGNDIQRMDFLWVRWFGEEPGYRYGFHHARLPKVGYVESSDDYAFGFLDPKHVIRGCHLIPAFHGGRTSALLPMAYSDARVLEGGTVDDWEKFYVNVYGFVVNSSMFKYSQHFFSGLLTAIW